MDEKIQINVIRSKRKTMSLEIKEDSTVLVRAPFRMADTEIQRFVQEKSGWIEKHLQIQQEKKKAVQQEGRLTMQEIQELADRALAEIPKRVAYYAAAFAGGLWKVYDSQPEITVGELQQQGQPEF